MIPKRSTIAIINLLNHVSASKKYLKKSLMALPNSIIEFRKKFIIRNITLPIIRRAVPKFLNRNEINNKMQ
jgi:hypothetical protein